MYGFRLLTFHHYTKLGAKHLINAQNYGTKTKFKMEAAAILNLFLMAIFNILPTLHYKPQPPYKILCQYLNPRPNYNNFLKFKMAAVRHVGFSKT